MNVARWTGAFAAALALGCATQQAETRTAPREGTTASGTSGAGGTSATAAMGKEGELPEVYGQVNEVSADEIEIEPAYGDPVKIKLDGQSASARASAAALEEGDEVRVAFDEKGGDKVAVDVQKDPPAEAILDNIGRDPARSSPAPGSGADSSSGSSSEPMGSEPSGSGTGKQR